MTATLVSIVIRSMGRECLANAVASVALQTHRPLELIVVDATGGAHPPLPDAPSLTRVRLVNAGRRLLRPAAANVGLDHAAGEWVGFLDDDDFFEPTHVARLLARGSEPDRPRLVHGQLWGLDRFHRVVTQRYTRCNPLIMYYNCQIGAMSCLVHRSLVDAGFRLDETLETSEDWDFWLSLMRHTSFGTVREPTHFYFAEAGTSGTGIGLNHHNRNKHMHFHEEVKRRYERQRDEAWASHFARLEEGIDLQRAGRLDAALAFYTRTIRECPDEPNAVYLKAQAHLQAGQLQAARIAFRQAIALNMDAADYHVGLAETCARLGSDDEARAAYANAVRFNPALLAALAPRVAALAPPAPAVASADGAAPATVARNAPCPCGSGQRYKQCHGKLELRAEPSPVAAASGVPRGEYRRRGLELAVAGSNRRAREAFARAIAQDPADVEALHGHALLSWDAGDLASAEAGIARTVALAPEDPQVVENQARIRNARFEREHIRNTLARLRTLVGTASGRPLPSPLPPGTAVHLVSPFENPFAGTEMHALEVAKILAPVAAVTLWSTQEHVPPALAAKGVVPIAADRGQHPRDGIIVIFGSWQTPPAWIADARPSRVMIVHNVHNPTALLDLVTGLLEQSALPVELLMPSEMFRRQSGLEGTVYLTPIDIARFAPPAESAPRDGFTVGRMSRNDHLKYHPDDPDLVRRMIDAGMRVRLMGGTVLHRHFPPASPLPALELLPPGSVDAAAFLRSLDAFVYRTSPHWLETAGRVVAEAMATGLPCVCAANVGFADIVAHGVNGFLVDPDDDDAMLAHLVALRDDAGLRRRMGAAARATVEQRFGPDFVTGVRRAYLGG